MRDEKPATLAYAPAPQTGWKVRNLRWYIAGLLMLATTLNYLDRQTLSVAVVSKELDIPDAQYSNIQNAWMIAYAVLIMTPIGPITPRNLLALREIRARRDQFRELMREYRTASEASS